MPRDRQDLILQTLQAIRDSRLVSQRRLAAELGVSLGYANLLVRQLVHAGAIETDRAPHGCRYCLTRQGQAAYARLSRRSLQAGIQGYAAVRDRVRTRLLELDGAWGRHLPSADGSAEKRVAFYGGGALAEITYGCLPETGLCLVAVIDGHAASFFYGVPVLGTDCLMGCQVAGVPFERLIVMSFVDLKRHARELSARAVPRERVVWL